MSEVKDEITIKLNVIEATILQELLKHTHDILPAEQRGELVPLRDQLMTCLGYKHGGPNAPTG